MEFLRDGCDDEPPQKKFYKQRRRRRFVLIGSLMCWLGFRHRLDRTIFTLTIFPW